MIERTPPVPRRSSASACGSTPTSTGGATLVCNTFSGWDEDLETSPRHHASPQRRCRAAPSGRRTRRAGRPHQRTADMGSGRGRTASRLDAGPGRNDLRNPDHGGTFTFSATVTDSLGATATREFTITIAPAPTPAPTPSPVRHRRRARRASPIPDRPRGCCWRWPRFSSSAAVCSLRRFGHDPADDNFAADRPSAFRVASAHDSRHYVSDSDPASGGIGRVTRSARAGRHHRGSGCIGQLGRSDPHGRNPGISLGTQNSRRRATNGSPIDDSIGLSWPLVASEEQLRYGDDQAVCLVIGGGRDRRRSGDLPLFRWIPPVPMTSGCSSLAC